MGILGQYCLQHQLHLIAERALVRGGHWPRLAMICHCWRASGVGKRVRAAYLEMYGADVAERCAATPPPVPIKGRWGSADASEARVLRCERTQLLAARRPQFRCHPGRCDLRLRALTSGGSRGPGGREACGQLFRGDTPGRGDERRAVLVGGLHVELCAWQSEVALRWCSD